RLELIVYVLALGAVRQVIAQVNKTAIGHATDQIGPLIHPSAESVEERLQSFLKFAGERVTVHPRRRLDTRQTEQGGRQLNKADQAVGLGAGRVLLWRETSPSFRKET